MKSKIYRSETVENKDRKSGGATHYQPAIIIIGEEEIRALFTIHDLDDAIERADRNHEDFPDKTFFEVMCDRFFG